MSTVAGHVPGQLEIVVRGRNVEVPEHFRDHVLEKLAKFERYDGKIHRIDVELQHEKNPRQNGSCQRVEITCRTRGPVVRAEACDDDFYGSLDLACDKLDRRLRTAADRRRIHHGRRTPASLGRLTADLPPDAFPADLAETAEPSDAGTAEDGPGRVVRRKQHDAAPMSVDQALEQMELVGHDFFLFSDAESGCATVVYRRHAYDYGLITLDG